MCSSDLISEPGADLAVAAALVSSLTGNPVPEGTVLFGEVGLSGDVRPVAHGGLRLKEAAKLGFKTAWAPKARGEAEDPALEVVTIRHLSDLVDRIGGSEADLIQLRERKAR